MKRGVWSEEEHARFLQAIRYYPEGPWSKIAGCIGTRSARQVQTHAQRYYEKVQRHVRGLQRDRSKSTHKEHRIDEDILRLQHLHRVAKTSNKGASTSISTTPTDSAHNEQEPHRRLYRSKDPPPCLQRLAGLPTQPSPVGVHDTPLVSPRFGAPGAGYLYDHHSHPHHQTQYSHPVSPMYDHSKVIHYPRYEPVYHQYAPPPPSMVSPRGGQQHRGGYLPMPSLPPIMTKLCETHNEQQHQTYNLYGVSSPSFLHCPPSSGVSPTGRASPHDSQVITSSIRSSEDPTTPRLPSVGVRPTLSLPQPGLLLPRIFS